MKELLTSKNLTQWLALLRDETANPSAIFEVAPSIADEIERLLSLCEQYESDIADFAQKLTRTTPETTARHECCKSECFALKCERLETENSDLLREMMERAAQKSESRLSVPAATPPAPDAAPDGATNGPAAAGTVLPDRIMKLPQP